MEELPKPTQRFPDDREKQQHVLQVSLLRVVYRNPGRGGCPLDGRPFVKYVFSPAPTPDVLLGRVWVWSRNEPSSNWHSSASDTDGAQP